MVQFQCGPVSCDRAMGWDVEAGPKLPYAPPPCSALCCCPCCCPLPLNPLPTDHGAGDAAPATTNCCCPLAALCPPGDAAAAGQVRAPGGRGRQHGGSCQGKVREGRRRTFPWRLPLRWGSDRKRPPIPLISDCSASTSSSTSRAHQFPTLIPAPAGTRAPPTAATPAC